MQLNWISSSNIKDFYGKLQAAQPCVTFVELVIEPSLTWWDFGQRLCWDTHWSSSDVISINIPVSETNNKKEQIPD